MGSSVTDLSPSYANESDHGKSRDDSELRKTLLAGLIGAIAAAGAYFIYTRLEDEQKEALRQTVGKFVEEKIAGVRSQLKF